MTTHGAEQLALLSRGVVDFHDAADLSARIASGRPLRVKAGFDPTRPDLHVGHTVLMQKMRQFQDLGHQVIFLIGDFTAMVGDPTGQNDLRPRLTRDEVRSAARSYQDQAFKVLDEGRTEVRYNSEWLGKLSLEELIGLAAKRTVARTLERRDFRERLGAHKDIWIHELLYPLLQAYDSVALDADVELGGTDQLFNLMVGRDLMPKYDKRAQIVMTTPILEGIDARIEGGVVVGKKMSKSAGNTIGLTEAPVEMFRKCMQIDDQVIWRFFELLSARTPDEVTALRAEDDPLTIKARFASEIVERFHTAVDAKAAEQTFRATYLADGVPADVPEVRVGAEGAGIMLAKALSAADLVKSTGEGRRLIEQGGVEVDSVRVKDPRFVLERGHRYLVRVGSKSRRFCYLDVAE